jgi:Protein of unknown function (DUF2723)
VNVRVLAEAEVLEALIPSALGYSIWNGKKDEVLFELIMTKRLLANLCRCSPETEPLRLPSRGWICSPNDFCAGIAQLVEHQIVDLRVTGSKASVDATLEAVTQITLGAVSLQYLGPLHMAKMKTPERDRRAVQKASKPVTAAAVLRSPSVAPLFRWIDWLTSLITFGVVWVVYFLTLAPELTLEDSGELVTGSLYAGIPHPPGYPVWTIYSWLWTVLVPCAHRCCSCPRSITV